MKDIMTHLSGLSLGSQIQALSRVPITAWLLFRFFTDQVQSNQPEESVVYYQSSYDSQPYGSSYSMPFTYGAAAAQSGKPGGAADNGSAHYRAPVGDLPPVSLDLVKKRLQDR